MIDLNNLFAEDTEYILNLLYHLATAGRADEFYELLTEFEFIEYKRNHASSSNWVSLCLTYLKSAV
ncbi:hypothetical protein [Microcoleus sp. T3_A4]|uniref:hypothetical protein n=1 Tax=Microcoleus sp. T3_A4 TaxID=2818968 RepID=UPI00404081D0